MRIAASLPVLALVGATVPSLHALTIRDETIAVGVNLQLQLRAQMLNQAEGAAGQDYDVLRGADGDAEALRFGTRRARFALNAKYGGWRANLTIRGGEQAERLETAGGRPVSLYYASGARVFRAGGIDHEIRFGLDKPFSSESSISTTHLAFPTERQVAERIYVVSPGIGYGLRQDWLTFGVDVMNDSTRSRDPQSGEPLGMFYSARVEVSPGKAFAPGRRQESYVAKEGLHLVGGFDVQFDDASQNQDQSATTYPVTDTLTWGPDLLVHWDSVTFLGEIRFRATDIETVTAATGAATTRSVDGRFANLQLAYAIPLGMTTVIEPAIRWGIRDDDTDVDAASVYAAARDGNDNGGEGRTIDLGVNLYFDGHGNKLQLAWQHWQAEAGDGQADIIRLQHQLAF